jgi:phosphoglycerol transferase MdoB-like AlkP superfamily enzyme
MTSKNKKASKIVCGILLVFLSIGGVVYSLFIGGLTASNIYGIIIDFVAMFILALFYLICAYKPNASE